MDLSPTDEQVHLRDSLTRFLAKAASPERVREAEPLGFDRDVWDGLVGIERGGHGPARHPRRRRCRVGRPRRRRRARRLGHRPRTHRRVHGRGPPARLARRPRRCLARAGSSRAPRWSPSPYALPPPAPPRSCPGPRWPTPWSRSTATPVSSCSCRCGPTARRSRTSASAPLADVATTGGRPHRAGLGRPRPPRSTAALDEWRALTAGWFVGLARARSTSACSTPRTASSSACRSGRSRPCSTAWPTSPPTSTAPSCSPTRRCGRSTWATPSPSPFPSMAFWFAGETAERVAAAALHVHGGYGFMEEYDIQLYFRRAKATRLLLGDPRRELLRLADRLWSADGDRPPLTTKLEAAPGRPARRPRAPAASTSGSGPRSRRSAPRSATFLGRARHRRGDRAGLPHRHHPRLGPAPGHGRARAGSRPAGRSSTAAQGRSPLEMNALTEEMYLSGAPVDGLGIATHRGPHPAASTAPTGRRPTIIPRILSGEVIVSPRLLRARRRLRRGRVRHQGRA